MSFNDASHTHPRPLRFGVLLSLAAIVLISNVSHAWTLDLRRLGQLKTEESWAFTSMTWQPEPEGLSDNGAARSHAVLLNTMDASHAWAEAELTVTGRTGGGWKVAGVSLYQDIRNYWHLALVEAPDELGGGHSVELRQMRDGVWGAEAADPKVSRIRSDGLGFFWREYQKYRLRLECNGRTIKGRVWDGQKRKVAEISYHIRGGRGAGYYPAVVNQSLTTVFHSLGFSAAGVQLEAENHLFFRVVEDSGRHWIKDTESRKLLSLGCEWVKYREIWCQSLGYSPYHRNSEKLFGTEAAWAADVAGKLRAWGFNTVGQSDRSEEMARQGLAYAPILRMGQGFSGIAAIVPRTFWTGFPDVFDPWFERYCRMVAENQCRPWRDDPRLLGYYIDNELEWFGKDGKPWSLFTSAMMLGPESAAKKAAVAYLRKRYPAISDFARAWQCSASSWAELESPWRLPEPRTPGAICDADGFVRLCAERYFSITAAAIRRADPNHLILGSRFAWVAPEPAWREAGRNCDIVSFNCYPRIEILSGEIPGLRDTIANRHSVCGRPLLISEWGFPALDAGLPSTKGAGMRVDDQEQRAYCAAKLQEEFLSQPWVVGTSWFMWADEPALGVTDSFPENSNYGLVDVGHRSYPHVTTAIGSVNRMAFEIHRGAVRPWRSGMLRAALFSRFGTRRQGEKPDVRMRQGRLEVDNGEVRLVLRPGKSMGVDSILWHGIPMGSYHPLVFQRRGGDGWLAPDRITGFSIDDSPGNGRALVFAAEYLPRDTVWAAFSVKFRLILPPQGSWFLAEVVEISSLDPRPWTLEGYYHYIPSEILEGPEGDRPYVPSVPNYWLAHGGWFDEKAGLHYGAQALEDAGWHFNPYIDSLGGQHPDIFKPVKRLMRQGEVYGNNDGPIVIYMGREGRSDHPWTKAAFQAWEWLRANKDGQQSP